MGAVTQVFLHVFPTGNLDWRDKREDFVKWEHTGSASFISAPCSGRW